MGRSYGYVDATGQKHVLGLWEGATEHAATCTALLENLVERGLRTDRALLLILDGSKTLRKAVRAVLGRRALVQRCQEHKKRIVLAALPDGKRHSVKQALNEAFRPAVKTVQDFDFTFQPSIKREQIQALHELGFVERKENVVFLGPPGVGKTHLAISLAIAAAEHGRRVYYGTLADLIDSLEEAKAAGRLTQRLKTLTHPALLVVDEIGYLPISQTGAMLFF